MPLAEMTAGLSILSLMAKASDLMSDVNSKFRVTCGIEVENLTSYTLQCPVSHTDGGGSVTVPAMEIYPGRREVMVRAS